MNEEKFTEERCKWIKGEDGVRHHIPGCIGGAVYGPGGCTCEENRIFQIDEILKEIRELKFKVSKLSDRQRNLEQENRQLKKAIMPKILPQR